MRHSPTLLALAGTAAVFFGSTGLRAADAELAGEDTQFLAEAIRDGMTEVELGKMAADKASSPEVKQFGQRMVQDHGKANQQLMELATKHKIEADGTYGTPPLRADQTKAPTAEDMAKLSGKEFDRTYAKMMVDDHKKAVALFKEQAEKGEDAEVRKAAATTLPTLEEHLQMAEKLAGEVGASQ